MSGSPSPLSHSPRLPFPLPPSAEGAGSLESGVVGGRPGRKEPLRYRSQERGVCKHLGEKASFQAPSFPPQLLACVGTWLFRWPVPLHPCPFHKFLEGRDCLSRRIPETSSAPGTGPGTILFTEGKNERSHRNLFPGRGSDAEGTARLGLLTGTVPGRPLQLLWVLPDSASPPGPVGSHIPPCL